ncbi:hypothetical protein [Actinocorallia populi]|uniref:hypothetical protein n=1 Tax=Actinocorallia populi TaxID=2079200 RepID=UPI0013005010|nr:hypothetical protein [Actinocorallia populi]
MNALLIPLMLAVPALCIAWLLPGLDPLGRAMVGAAGSLSLFLLTAQTMLVLEMWSPAGGAAAVGAFCLVMAAVRLLRGGGRPAAAPAAREHADAEDEDWLFDE